jgi:hypothetical protein
MFLWVSEQPQFWGLKSHPDTMIHGRWPILPWATLHRNLIRSAHLFSFVFLSVNNVGVLPNLFPSHFFSEPDEIQVGLCASVSHSLRYGACGAGDGETKGKPTWSEFCMASVLSPAFLLTLELGTRSRVRLLCPSLGKGHLHSLCISKLTWPLSHSFGILNSVL